MKNKYSSVSEMLSDNRAEKSFVREFDEMTRERSVAKNLLTLRNLKGLTQAEMAQKLDCSQSRISKIENGTDEQIGIKDIVDYAQVLGFQVEINLAPQNRTIADKIKYHVFQIKNGLDDLAALAHKDDSILDGVRSFYGEAFFNFVKNIQDSAQKLPKTSTTSPARVKVKVIESDSETTAPAA